MGTMSAMPVIMIASSQALSGEFLKLRPKLNA